MKVMTLEIGNDFGQNRIDVPVQDLTGKDAQGWICFSVLRFA